MWSLRTNQRESTWQTPFRLVYGTQALIPVEIGSTSLRLQMYQGAENERVMAKWLELVEEVREKAALRMQAYVGKVARHYNRRVKIRVLQVWDLVLRKSTAVQKARIHGKLSATWEGPYQIYEVQSGTYKLMDLEGVMLPNNWKVYQLKKYFM
ncbi:Transposon Tf2-11 polyprotein [Bienertia sinuspersici]